MISALTNSEIGSVHWFNTLTGRIRDNSIAIAKTIDRNDQIDLLLVKNWANSIETANKELSQYREQINKITVLEVKISHG
jgi:hypothetical protein